LIFGCGQVAAGIGYSIGQVACGWYVPYCQMGLALYKLKCAQGGFNFLNSFR
jgi:hypothetical protein